MSDDQPDIPDAYADLVAAMVDTNSGTVKPDRVVTRADAALSEMKQRAVRELHYGR